MIPVLTTAQRRHQDATASVPMEVLIDRAGSAVAREALRLLGGGYGRTVNVIAGPGNNGADGRVAADRLRERGVVVRVFDATGGHEELPPSDLVIDAAFGSGFRDGWCPPGIGTAPVLAVDVPTGVDADSGTAGPDVLAAAVTVTFGGYSPGHVFGKGSELAGRVVVADIGLPDAGSSVDVVEALDVKASLPDRAVDAHKWAHGVRVVAGSPGMTGAARLTAAAAMRAGSGMVALSSPGIDAGADAEIVERRVPPFDWAADVLSDLYRFRALVVGPGLGREEYTVPSLTRTVLEALVPVVIDGDGLFALSWNEAGTAEFLNEREVPTVLTPHDGEYALLMGRRPGADRIGAALELASLTGATVLLKGPTTTIAAPDGRVHLVVHGSQRLATAGSGDVLSGLIGALLAQGLPALEAASAAAWIHAEAASLSHDGLVASDLLTTIPLAITSLRET